MDLYEIRTIKVRTPIDTYYYVDIYDSLCNTYSAYRCTGDMFIVEKETGKRFILTFSSDGTILSQDYDSGALPISYSSFDETGDFKGYFQELYHAVWSERNRLLRILNDTKNYKARTSARLIGDAICVFSEEYNYSIPELNEYYVMKLSKGHYLLEVYNKSAFMSLYLPENEYIEYYGGFTKTPYVTYESLQQIEDRLLDKDMYLEKEVILKMRKKAFIKMKDVVDKLYNQIKKKEKFIRNLDRIYDNQYDVLRYYNLEEDYKCKYDDEYSEIIECLPAKTYVLSDGTEIEISVEDLQRAFELGFEDFQQICEIKAKLGSIEAVL